MLILDPGHLGATFFSGHIDHIYLILDEHQIFYQENGLDGRTTFVCRVSKGCTTYAQNMLNSN